MSLYHLCVRAILCGRYAGDELSVWMERADEAEVRWQRAETLLDTWRGASWDAVLAVFRSRRRAA